MPVILDPVSASVDRDFTVFDAYVNDGSDLGLFFQDDPQNPPSNTTLRLKPVRQDTGNNPFEVRPEFGDIFAQGDFSHGAGQEYFHPTGRDPKKFLASEGFDISKPGKLRHLNAAVVEHAE